MAALGMLIVALAPTLPVMVGGFLFYCVGNAWFVPNVMTSLGSKVLPHQQSRAAGLVKCGQFLSTPICVVLVEPYARRFGAETVMLLACAMASFAAALMLVRMATARRGAVSLDQGAVAGAH
jgi:predicted MFS family arabinose efflux permease